MTAHSQYEMLNSPVLLPSFPPGGVDLGRGQTENVFLLFEEPHLPPGLPGHLQLLQALPHLPLDGAGPVLVPGHPVYGL